MTAELPLSDRPTDLMGVRAIAAALKSPVSPSTISRQFGAGLFTNYGTESAPLLSLAEVEQKRASGLNPAQQRRAPSSRPAKAGDGYHSARAEREQAAAAIAKLDLAERLGELLPRAAVEDAYADLGRKVREATTQMVRKAVPELEQIEGTEARIAHLTARLESCLTALADEFEAQGDGIGSASPS